MSERVIRTSSVASVIDDVIAKVKASKEIDFAQREAMVGILRSLKKGLCE